MSSDTNVVMFPKNKKSTPPQSLEEMAEKAAEYKRNYTQEFSEMLYNYVFTEMARDGVDFETDEDLLFPNIVLVMESIVALHMRANGLHHPLQDFADEAFEESMTEEKKQEFVESLSENGDDEEDEDDV